MIELILDTSYTGLNIGLVKDNVILEKIEIKAERQQSEITMPTLDELFKKNNLKPLDLSAVIITSGPGSYTGLRIAMTIAKVMGSIAHIPVYTINTLLAYVHPSYKKGLALMDARSKRAYYALIECGEIKEMAVKPIESIESESLVFGDGHLINVKSEPFSLIENILAYRNKWELIGDIDSLSPLYLKENSDYGH